MSSITRRRALGAAAGALATGALAGGASAQSEPDYGGWFSNVGNFDGTTVDARDQDEVTVSVGADGNGGAFAFDPPAVMVSPGTTVVWEWTGSGGGHNVVATDGTFDSGEIVADGSTTFRYTFESEGLYKYVCEPHEALGMKGAVVVRSGGGGGGESEEPTGPPANPDYGGFLSNVGNFDGTADRLGQDQVSVAVGADANGGAFGFGPAAVRVSVGTTVTWEWTGKGGGHNVVATDGTFDSGDLVSEGGHTYEYTFDEPGLYTYVCEPHESLGMKGAIVVGAPPEGGGDEEDAGPTTTAIEPGFGLGAASVLLAFLAPLGFAAYARHRAGRPAPGDAPRATESEEPDPTVDIGHDEFDPWGTAALIVAYFVIIALLWVFMYFVEFLGRVSVVG